MNDRAVHYGPTGGARVGGRWARRAWSGSVVVAATTLLMACATTTSASGGASVSAPSATADTGAAQVPAGCLLLVRGLAAPTIDQTAGVYTGAFLVLRVGTTARSVARAATSTARGTTSAGRSARWVRSSR